MHPLIPLPLSVWGVPVAFDPAAPRRGADGREPFGRPERERRRRRGRGRPRSLHAGRARAARPAVPVLPIVERPACVPHDEIRRPATPAERSVGIRRMTNGRPAILAAGLVKRFGTTEALRGLDLAVEAGTVFGLLGPNGAGKTTAVRIFTTLVRPDAGRAEVTGFDVVRQAAALRAQIGLAGQYAAVDEYLTGRENLEMVGRLYHLPRAAARRRADELLERFDLVDAGGRLVKTYSGGMRRRLDLAASLIVSPPVLFLDEPTTGLDPRSRMGMWEVIRGLAADGTTVLLTTQYLEEADQLAAQIAVIDDGRVIARGTPDELKAQVGGARLEVTVAPGSDFAVAVRVLRPYGGGALHVDAERRRIVMPSVEGVGLLAAVVRDLDAAGVRLDDLGVHRPTLDDVFLTLTGRTAGPAPGEESAPAAGPARRGPRDGP
jgi:ABC-2 type transport system ATP-binding protein